MSSTKGTIFDEQTKIWHGPETIAPTYDADRSIGRTLFSKMKVKPKAIALQSDVENCSVTYEELLRDSIRIAEHLNKLVPNQDDIVGIVSGHTTYVTHILCASWFNATAVHPVNPAHEQAVIQHIFGITRPKIIFCEGKYYQKVLKSCQQLQLHSPIYTINDHIEGVHSLLDLIKPTGTEKFYEPKELKNGRDQTVLIINSSGTSGLPKAVCKSNHSVCIMPFVSEGDVSIVFSPLDWITAISYTISTIIECTKRIITTSPYTPEYFIKLLEKYKITNTLLCPSYLASLVYTPNIKQSLSSLRIVYCGGAILPVPVFRKIRELLQPEQIFLNAYGASEFSTVIACNYNVEKPNAVGQIMPGVRVKIIEADGRLLSVGEIGEVLLYNGATWNGYYNDPVSTQEMCDNEMWFHTGDLGYFDQDGDLFIVDRKKDVMKYRGVHYTPQEIEQVIAQLPGVVEVCVFGNTNDVEGDRPAAAIVRQKDSKLTAAEVTQYVAKHFDVEWKRLHGGVFFMSSLPKTGNGKVIRKDTKMVALQRVAKAN